MRALLGWLLILACCGTYGYLQMREDRGLQAAGDGIGPESLTLDQRESTWRELTIGRPSGAVPLELELWQGEDQWFLEEPSLGLDEGPAPGDEPAPPQPPLVAADFQYEVPAGRVLSKICEEFYGTGRAPVPELVSAYNGMGSPDALRAGQTLLLPAWEVLFPDADEQP